VEVKILNIDRNEVEEKLRSLGAEKEFDGEVHALFFDFPDKLITDDSGMLRLRKVGERTQLTFKRAVSSDETKIRDEREVEISDFDTARDILQSMGLSVWLEMRKHRTTYSLLGVHFEFDKHHDQYEFIPEFLEIEAVDPDTVYKYAQTLGFKKDDCKPWTILDIVRNLYPDKQL
ncbi:MAG: class IV adenylate cyclase, partial [Dehalococcoidia bacterium]